jgi:hypothetical protein
MRHAVALATLLSLAVPVLAVPLPRGGPVQLAPLSDKYLPDDADLVAVLNVRQVLASPAYRNVFAGQLGELLRQEKVAATLKEFGLDPMKDIDRICAVMARSGLKNNRPGFFLLVQGRFDPAKVDAGAKKLAKATSDHGKAKIHELALPHLVAYAAVLDKAHVVLASGREQVQAALDKAAGKNKTVLKSKALVAMLGRLKAEDSLSVVATGETVVGGGRSEVNGKVTASVFTLADMAGIEALTVVASMKDHVRVKVTMTSVDAAKAMAIEKAITKGIQEAMGEKEIPHLAKALKNLKIGRKDRIVTIEGRGPGEAVRDLIYGFVNERHKGPQADLPPPKVKP